MTVAPPVPAPSFTPLAPSARRALDAIAYKTISSHSLGEVLDTVTRGLTEEMGAALARIWLCQESEECPVCIARGVRQGALALHLHASAGINTNVADPFHRIPLSEETLAVVAVERTPLLRNDVPGHHGAVGLQWLQWEDIQSIAAYPLVFRDKVLGVLAILADRTLTDAEFEMLGAFAAQATVAIENALLFEEAARSRAELERQVEERTADLARKALEAETRARELAALNGVSQAMARSFKSDDIVADVLQTVLSVTGFDTGLIHLEESGVLRAVAAAGLPAFEDARKTTGVEGMVGSVLARGEPVVMAEMDDHDARARYAHTFGRPVENAASVPITARGRALGVLSVASVSAREFTVRDLQLLRSIAQQMGLALDNARLLHAAEERSEMLATAIQETHHRVKNNLQAISSLLEMHLMQPGDLRAGMRRVMDQVRAIALVHDFLSQDADLRGVNVKPVLQSLVPMAARSHTRSEQDVKVSIHADEVMMPSKEATSMALIVTELVANAVEHGLADRPSGNVSVRLTQDKNATVMEVRDDGHGIPEGFAPDRDGHLGTELVQRLARRHLKGRVEYIRDGGTVVRVTLPGAVMG